MAPSLLVGVFRSQTALPQTKHIRIKLKNTGRNVHRRMPFDANVSPELE
ncbi:hypothetical protein MY3296_009988 [Beauveria thailandica]